MKRRDSISKVVTSISLKVIISCNKAQQHTVRNRRPMLIITTFIYPDNRGLGKDKLDRFKFKTINVDEKGEKLGSFCAQWL